MANIKQAYDWYQEGNKIRHKDWGPLIFSSREHDTFRNFISPLHLFSDGWELYKEPMSEETKEALREVVRLHNRSYYDTFSHDGLREIIKSMGVDL